MIGIKRSHDGAEKDSKTSPFMPMFEMFRNELDEHHDRRERIIKASRDITATSKKMQYICSSKVCTTVVGPLPADDGRVRGLKSDLPDKIASETREKAESMKKQFASIASDLSGLNAWRYQRQISGGIQEYMEAVSFEHYLRHQTLITIEEASASLDGKVELTGDDYVLGIFDLVGELMRFAITTMATTGSLPESGEASTDRRDILIDMRELRSRFESLDTSSCGGSGLGKDVEKKMEVMKTCVEKVETAVYGMMIRGRERPKGWVPDMTSERAPVEGF